MADKCKKCGCCTECGAAPAPPVSPQVVYIYPAPQPYTGTYYTSPYQQRWVTGTSSANLSGGSLNG